MSMGLLAGVTHNVPLLHDVISHPKFVHGDLSTKFLAQEYPSGFAGTQLDAARRRELAAVAAAMHVVRAARDRGLGQLLVDDDATHQLHVRISTTGKVVDVEDDTSLPQTIPVQVCNADGSVNLASGKGRYEVRTPAGLGRADLR